MAGKLQVGSVQNGTKVVKALADKLGEKRLKDLAEEIKQLAT
jgi:hypothetical protein